MGRLFLFGIGGTGSRVIRSLTMLLASGVEIKAEAVIPIIIDPDLANGDTNRTISAIKEYQIIREPLSFTQNTFFKAEIQALSELKSDGEVAKTENYGFKFSLDGVENQRFDQFINYHGLDKENQALVDLLFSKKNLESHMQVGFKGNPNIGSVVLNQFKDSQYFRQFASMFKADDRIFIISSIFGGTGAAGFPLLLNNLRNADDNLSNHGFLRNAKIGAVTVMPYFGVKPDSEKEIDKNTFISKTKAALSYYSRNITGANKINALYYIGDKTQSDYENNEGAEDQKNDAHFVEFASALAIIDFMELPDAALANNGGRVVQPVYKEFGVNENSRKLFFNQLGEKTVRLVRKPLLQFCLLTLYVEQRIQESIGKQPWSLDGNVNIPESFLSDYFYSSLYNFTIRYSEWLKELDRNDVAFSPFNTAVQSNNVFSCLNGHAITNSIFGGLKKDNFELIDSELNRFEKKADASNSEAKFMSMFSMATKEVIRNKYKF